MKYLGIIYSQNIDTYFEKNKVQDLIHFTKTDKLPIRIGFIFVDGMFVLKNLAIQLDNSSTYEVFEIFELNNLQTTTEKEMKDLVNQIAEEVVKYNKDILKYYKG